MPLQCLAAGYFQRRLLEGWPRALPLLRHCSRRTAHWGQTTGLRRTTGLEMVPRPDSPKSRLRSEMVPESWVAPEYSARQLAGLGAGLWQVRQDRHSAGEFST